MSVNVNFKLKLQKGLKNDIIEGVKGGLETSALAFEREAKLITTEEQHVVTGRYRASINLNAVDGAQRAVSIESKSGDGVHSFDDYKTLNVGSNVEYALDLEKRYGILGRALDRSKGQMMSLFTKGFTKKVKWIQ